MKAKFRNASLNYYFEAKFSSYLGSLLLRSTKFSTGTVGYCTGTGTIWRYPVQSRVHPVQIHGIYSPAGRARAVLYDFVKMAVN
eukprot:SAG31_NODE_7339_length_1715_cov_3.082302_1_plen_83_part_10